MKTANKEIIQELQRIASQTGGVLKPENVIESARALTSPLHSKFTWDDTEAAHLYRLEEARRLIRVTVQVLSNGSNEEERVWVSLQHDQNQEGGGYRTLVSVLSDVQLRKQLLEQAMRDMEYFKVKYCHLEELAEVFSSIKRIKVKMKE